MYDNILEAIGRTPMVRINKLNPNPNVPLYAKLEGFNPTGSIKDRIALKMIEQAEECGALTKGKTIIEPTSGNTGIGLAMIGAVKGYEVEIVMSEAVSIERRKMIQAFGGKITLTDPSQGRTAPFGKPARLSRNTLTNISCRTSFPTSTTSLPTITQRPAKSGTTRADASTHFVSALGTSGTIMGVGMGLKKKNPKIQIIEAQPVKNHYIQGLKNMQEAIVPEIYDPEEIDRHVMIESEEAFEMARSIVRQEGIFVGMSSGAAMLAALDVIKDLKEGFVVVLFADRGEKYLSTDLFKV
jgi:cysteine synthase B